MIETKYFIQNFRNFKVVSRPEFTAQNCTVSPTFRLFSFQFICIPRSCITAYADKFYSCGGMCDLQPGLLCPLFSTWPLRKLVINGCPFNFTCTTCSFYWFRFIYSPQINSHIHNFIFLRHRYCVYNNGFVCLICLASYMPKWTTAPYVSWFPYVTSFDILPTSLLFESWSRDQQWHTLITNSPWRSSIGVSRKTKSVAWTSSARRNRDPVFAGLSSKASQGPILCRSPWWHRFVFVLNIISKRRLLNLSPVLQESHASQGRSIHAFCQIYFSFYINPNLSPFPFTSTRLV